MLRIDDGAAFKSGDDAFDFHAAFRLIDGDFRAGGDVSTFFKAAGYAEAAVRGGLRLAPAEAMRCGFADAAHPCILEIAIAKFERIDAELTGHFVHVRFADEVICGCREAAVGALT